MTVAAIIGAIAALIGAIAGLIKVVDRPGRKRETPKHGNHFQRPEDTR